MPNPPPPDLTIRPEHPADAGGISRVITAAFESSGEARLVERLRVETPGYVGFVATTAVDVIGHVAFTPVSIADSSATSLLALAPLAVTPRWWRHGIGAALTRRGLAAIRDTGATMVFVLGAPSYYRRFGFEPAAPHGYHFRSPEFDSAFMVLPMTAAGITGPSGFVEYAGPFDDV